LHEADARSLPFKTGAFDCVSMMGNSFGYFADPKDDRAVLGEVRRVLDSGGRIYLDLADGDWLRSHFEARSWDGWTRATSRAASACCPATRRG